MLNSRGAQFLRVLLNREHNGAVENTLKMLPEEEAQAVLSQNIRSDNLQPFLIQPEDLFKQLHYSWLMESIQQFPSHMQPYLVLSLPDEQSVQIRKQLPVEDGLKLSPLVKTYFQNLLAEKIHEQSHIPLELLPEFPLSSLATLSKNELQEVVDYLGLYDLADEVRRIVDTKGLKNIYAGLGSKQQQFLRHCLHQKEKLVSTRLNIDHWQGDNKELLKIIHKRGLIRLGQSLSGHPKEFVHHLSQTLDTGRGKLLIQFSSNPTPAPVAQILTSQVQSVLNFLKEGRP